MALDKFNAPPLPNPPGDWDAQYMRQVLRVLEIYFSQLDSNTPNHAQKYTADEFVGGTFTGTFSGSGTFIDVPFGQFISTTDQTASSIANANILTFNTSDFTGGVTLASSSHLVIPTVGIYQINFSMQFQSDSTSTELIDIWLRKNGTNLPGTNSQFSLAARKSAGIPSALIAVTPIMVSLAANDYIEIVWRVSDTAVSLQYLPAVTASGTTPAIPATPSAIVQVQFVSHS
jgi:hypothetical protein